MKIPNPWPRHPFIRCTCKSLKGEYISVGSGRDGLEVNDDVDEVLIEALRNGKPTSDSICAPKMWTKKWGLNEMTDHAKRMQLEKQEAEFDSRMARDAERKIKEARERAKVVEKPAKAVEEKPAKVVSEKMSMGKELKL